MIMFTLSTPASMATSISFITLRVALQISAFSPASLINLTASFSPGETAAKPASITFTPKTSRLLAISSFLVGVKLIPGVCSPSRSVVSKNCTCFGYLFNKAIPHFPHVPPTQSTPKFKINSSSSSNLASKPSAVIE
jgi:hypothetical protein